MIVTGLVNGLHTGTNTIEMFCPAQSLRRLHAIVLRVLLIVSADAGFLLRLGNQYKKGKNQVLDE